MCLSGGASAQDNVLQKSQQTNNQLTSGVVIATQRRMKLGDDAERERPEFSRKRAPELHVDLCANREREGSALILVLEHHIMFAREVPVLKSFESRSRFALGRGKQELGTRRNGLEHNLLRLFLHEGNLRTHGALIQRSAQENHAG